MGAAGLDGLARAARMASAARNDATADAPNVQVLTVVAVGADFADAGTLLLLDAPGLGFSKNSIPSWSPRRASFLAAFLNPCRAACTARFLLFSFIRCARVSIRSRRTCSVSTRSCTVFTRSCSHSTLAKRSSTPFTSTASTKVMPAARISAARAAFRTAEDRAGGVLPATCVPQTGVVCTCCALLRVVDDAAADARRLGDSQLVRFGDEDADASRAACMPFAAAACLPWLWGAIERAAVHVPPTWMSTLAAGCCSTRTPGAAGR